MCLLKREREREMSSFPFLSSSPLSSPNGPSSTQYTFNSRIMVAAMVILFIVVFFVVSLHIYAKWFWRQSTSFSSNRRMASWRRRRQLDFVGNAPIVSHGLDQAIIDSLPTFFYRSPKPDEEALLECAVCLSEFQENETVRILPKCKHSFHVDCIGMWFHSHSTCPLCRTAVLVADTPLQNTSVEGPLPTLANPQNIEGVRHHQNYGQELANMEGTAADGSVQMFPSVSASNGTPYLGDESNHVGCDNHIRFQLSSPCIGGNGSSSTRSLPHISIEMPRQLESGTTMPRCVSLSLPRCPSVEDRACTTSQYPPKAPSRLSIKWLLSREGSRDRSRIFPTSGQGSGEMEPNTSNNVSVGD